MHGPLAKSLCALLFGLLVALPACADWHRWIEPANAPFLPVPEIDLDPDSGTTVGLIPTWLKTGTQGDIRQIIAPDVLYNSYFGLGARGRIFAYPSPDTQWSVVAGLKQRVEREFDAEYQSGLTRGDRWSFSASAIYDRNGTTRFFGIGNRSPQSAQTNYTDEQSLVAIRVGWNITPRLQLGYLWRAREVAVLPGTLADLPSIQQRFPDEPGLGHQHALLNRLQLRYDSRDDITVPTRGVALALYGGFASRHGLFNASLYSEAGIDAREFVPLDADTTLAAHVSLHYLLTATQPPFWALSALGGDQSVVGGDQLLRGFGSGRFVDRNALSASVEVRRTVARISSASMNIELQLAPFMDVGRVFARSTLPPLDGLHHVLGIGVRALARPFVVGYLDIGYGSAGAAAFTGINYPF